MSETRRHRHDHAATRPPEPPEQVHEPRRRLPAIHGWLVPTDPPSV